MHSVCSTCDRTESGYRTNTSNIKSSLHWLNRGIYTAEHCRHHGIDSAHISANQINRRGWSRDTISEITRVASRVEAWSFSTHLLYTRLVHDVLHGRTCSLQKLLCKLQIVMGEMFQSSYSQVITGLDYLPLDYLIFYSSAHATWHSNVVKFGARAFWAHSYRTRLQKLYSLVSAAAAKYTVFPWALFPWTKPRFQLWFISS